MTLSRDHRAALSITALLIWTLACRAATRLIIPDTPTPAPTSTPTVTFTPTLTPTITPSPTPTQLVYEASCPLVVDQIIEESVFAERLINEEESGEFEDINYMVQYSVDGDEIDFPKYYPVSASLEDEQEDRAVHEEVWRLFVRLIPPGQRDFVSGFAIFTDGRENYLAGVSQSDRSPYQWDLNVDIFDSTDKITLTYTLLHEHGHLLTLNQDQVEVSLPVYENPDDENIYASALSECPRYFTGEGCSQPDAYLSEFFDRFWVDLYDEWRVIDEEESERARDRLLNRFYNTYQDQFLTDYAPTSPAEDIAEAWAFFILQPKPELTSISSEKILFFYEYPELVELRMNILENICTEFSP